MGRILAGIVMLLLLAATVLSGEPDGQPTRLPLPIGVMALDEAKLSYFNQCLEPEDQIMFPAEHADAMAKVAKAQKGIMIRGQEFAKAEQIIASGKEKGASHAAFNLEGPIPVAEIVRQQQAVYTLARKAGMSYTFAPTVVNLRQYYKDFVPHADILVLQSQRYQTDADYKELVTGLIANIKKANPRVRVWVQVSVNPPGNRDISAAAVLRCIHDIAGTADGICLFYHPTRWATLQAVMTQLRPLPDKDRHPDDQGL